MRKIILSLLCFVYCTSQGVTLDQLKPIEIQKTGKHDICKIGNIDDGDTFDIDCSSGYYHDVRLIGVNTPDYNYHTEGGKCYYDEAKSYIKKRNRGYTKGFFIEMTSVKIPSNDVGISYSSLILKLV